MALVAKRAFVAEACARVFPLIHPKEQNQLEASFHVLDDEPIGPAHGLALPAQQVPIEAVFVLSAVRLFVHGDEQPHRVVTLGLEDPVVQGRIRDPELPAQIFAGLDAPCSRCSDVRVTGNPSSTAGAF